MNEAKKKAESLYFKYYDLIPTHAADLDSLDAISMSIKKDIEITKQCCHISVDLAIHALGDIISQSSWIYDSRVEFWNEVKLEIDKL